jgi:hypothetical protein
MVTRIVGAMRRKSERVSVVLRIGQLIFTR